ncbi:MAG TPA: FtsX-like permease family protein [Hanamia sp.]|nr:FtsX-like permease family protein [Hanamia sp.]
MFKNYIKIAWRNLIKNKTLSIINITGLSVSIAFCLVLFFYIRYEQSYDSFNTKKDHLYRLEMTSIYPSRDTAKKSFFSFLTKNDDVSNQLVFPVIVAANMQNEFPEIKSITRFKDNGDLLVKVNNQTYKEKDCLFADSNFFCNFSFHLLEGNPKTVLKSNNNIVISASLAKKYFGNEDAVGKTIELDIDTALLYTVSGIAEDAPENSSIQYSLIVPIESDPDYQEQIKQGFNQATTLYMVELANNVDYKKFETKMNKWVEQYYTKPYEAEYGKYMKDFDFTKFRWYLRPFTDCHYNISQPWGHYTDAKSIYQLACLVIIILLIASLNYILLVISNAAARSQEIGIRKVLGAKRRSVVFQFWTETQLLIIFAVVIGLLLSQPLLFLFNDVMQTHIHFNNFSWKEILVSLIVLSLVLGLLAGYYPALILSKMKPASIIKSFQTYKINPRFSKIMVIVQYTACVVLMFAAVVINLQMHYITNKNLGFDKDQVLMVENPTFDFNFTKRVHYRLKVYAKSQPSIIYFSGMNGGLDGSYNTNGFILNGEQKFLKQLTVDYNYFEMLGIKFIEGRPFSEAYPSDTSNTIRPSIVNETLFKMLGKDAKLGVYNKAIRSTIIGVVKDYNFETLSKKIEPEQHVLAKNYEQYFMFKVRAGEMQSTIAKLQKEWKQITNNYPFEYTFLDQSIAKMYEADRRWQSIIQAACYFAMFIACLGLFGLAAINAVNRTKEIGIRKVLGADLKDVVAALSSGFILTFIIAIAIAIPLAYWIMNKWLQNFAYRINLNWWIFIVVSLVALSIALLTVSIQAIKAALANPVDSLRSE